jgi:glycosyltransferase involved in cell wall biosynthesis
MTRRLLFIHQNFPGQFKFLAPALADMGHEVLALTTRQGIPENWLGVKVLPYSVVRGTAAGVHPWVSDIEAKVIRAEACFRAALKLRQQGFVPDVIVAHPGWGESMFLKDVWPEARLGIYAEFFYLPVGADVGFDPEFKAAATHATAPRLRLKNVNSMLHFDVADAAISPTHWQADTFPMSLRSKISVVHDGIDTRKVGPNPDARLEVNADLVLTRQDEVVTFVNRNLEPYRGVHSFLRSLPELLARRPKTQVLIVGGDGVSYGLPPDEARFGKRSWRHIFSDEVRPQISDEGWARVHFLGNIPYDQFLSLMQVSTVHVYLTYPFVVSWSLLEAMSAGCAVVASDTGPVKEMIQHDQTGRLVDFFDVAGLSDAIADLLDSPAERARLGAAAREHIVANYDLGQVCLPRQLAWVESLTRP